MAAFVHRQRTFPYRTGPRTYSAARPVERDAALRVEREHPQPHLRPSIRGQHQRTGLAGAGARHVVTRHAGHAIELQHRRSRGQPGAGRGLLDGMRRADVDAISAPRARREKRDLRDRARRAEPASLHHPLFGMARHLASQPPERLPEEFPSIAGVGRHQKLGARDICHRNFTRPSRDARSAAKSHRLTTSGSSRRVVQVRSPIACVATRPTPASYKFV